MAEIRIDKNKCNGCFKCVHVCHNVFEAGFDGLAKVRYGVSNADILDARSAEICCPTGAIKIVEDSWFDNSGSGGNKGLLESILDWADSSSPKW